MDYKGWTGKILRVDLTTGEISSEDTMKYKDFLGGTGLGYKVLWDEVPAGTKAWDPENRLIFGVGPLTGTGAPLSGRVSVTSLWPVLKNELPATGHMGGHWGAELKFAGWDSIIIQGKAEHPVWLYINDDNEEFESVPWDLLEAGDPAFLQDIMRRITFKEGDLGKTLADGPHYLEDHWPEMAEAHQKEYKLQSWKWGQAKHHSIENGGQIGTLINLVYNPEDKDPFTPGVDKMDRDDMELAKDMFYAQLGWDKETGMPTRATLTEVGLADVADELEKQGLLPA